MHSCTFRGRLHDEFQPIQPTLKVSPCNRKRLFKKICSGGRGEISARAEIRHVIAPFNACMLIPIFHLSPSVISFIFNDRNRSLGQPSAAHIR